MFVFPYVATEMHTQTKEYICSGLDNPTIYSTLLFRVMNIQDIDNISRCYYHIHFRDNVENVVGTQLICEHWHIDNCTIK